MMMHNHRSAANALEGQGGMRCHYVHVYAVVRVKLAVEATGHRGALEQADAVLRRHGFPVRMISADKAVVEAEFAQEVTGYLVDEAGDPDHMRSRAYRADHQPDDGAV